MKKVSISFLIIIFILILSTLVASFFMTKINEFNLKLDSARLCAEAQNFEDAIMEFAEYNYMFEQYENIIAMFVHHSEIEAVKISNSSAIEHLIAHNIDEFLVEISLINMRLQHINHRLAPSFFNVF